MNKLISSVFALFVLFSLGQCATQIDQTKLLGAKPRVVAPIVGDECIGLFYIRYIAYVHSEPDARKDNIVDEIHVGQSRTLIERVPGKGDWTDTADFFRVNTGYVLVSNVHSITTSNGLPWCTTKE